MKKKLLVIFAITFILALTGCKDVEHTMKDIQAESTGLNRHIRIMTADGRTIAEFDGMIDIRTSETSNGVVFEYEGKRYAYYNCFVEAVEK